MISFEAKILIFVSLSFFSQNDVEALVSNLLPSYLTGRMKLYRTCIRTHTTFSSFAVVTGDFKIY